MPAQPKLPTVPEVVATPVQTSRFPLATQTRFAAHPVEDMELPPLPTLADLTGDLGEPEKPKVATSFDLAAYAKQLAAEAGSPEAHEYVLQTISLCDRPDVIAEAWAREAVKDALRCHNLKERLEAILAMTDPKTRPRGYADAARDVERARAEERRARQWVLSLMRQARQFREEDARWRESGQKRHLRSPRGRVNDLTLRLRERAGADPGEAGTG